MLIKDIDHCEEFIASDGSLLRQLLHPEKMDIACRYSLCHATLKPGQWLLLSGSDITDQMTTEPTHESFQRLVCASAIVEFGRFCGLAVARLLQIGCR